jgi:hypothetical protein
MRRRTFPQDTSPAIDAIVLSVRPDTVCFLIAKSREFDVKTPSSDPHAGALDDDDIAAAALEDRPSDPVEDELRAIIGDLDYDARIDLVALMWLGREGTSQDDWGDLRERAERRDTGDTADYLLGTPLLSDYLAEGMSMAGHDCTEFLRGHG